MKTIQQCFLDSNIDDIISRYVHQYPIEIKNLDEFVDKDLMISEIYNSYIDKIRFLIEKIQKCSIEESDEDWIFFAHHICNFSDDITFSLVKKSELLDETVLSYAYEFSPVSETAGFLVADTYLTQYYLEDLLVDYLFESSFFGYDQEYLETEKFKLEQDAKYLNEHLDELLEDSKNHTPILSDFEFEKRDEQEIEAWKSYISHEIEYDKIAFEIEKQKVIELLEG